MSSRDQRRVCLPRSDTAEAWQFHNPVLRDRELGIEEDTLRLKIGDESERPWNDLTYAPWPTEIIEFLLGGIAIYIA